MAFVALMLSGGCLRLGYDAHRVSQPDASKRDASMEVGADAAMHLDASAPDASARDAAMPATKPDAAAQDAAMSPPDGGPDAATSSMDAALDAASPDAAMDGAAPSDPCLGRTDLLFCSGFEDPALPEWETAIENNATVQPSMERRRSGSHSLHAVVDAAPSGVLIARREVDAFKHQASGDVWSRAYFYLPGSVVIDAASSIATLRMSGTEVPSFGCALVIRTDFVELGGVATALQSSSPFPRDRWTCVELHIVLDASTGLCEAYIDSTLATRSSQVNTVPGNGYNNLSVGFSLSNAAQGSFDLYFDDVAASSARVGCD